MKIIVCAVRDSAMDSFAQPMFFPTIGVALRTFTDEVNREDPNNNLHKHADDYELHQLAVFEDETGTFDEEKRMLLRAKDAKNFEGKSFA